MKFVDYFDRVYILNLPERSDRKIEMEQEIQRIGISPAHDKIVFYSAKKFADPYPFANPGSKGCFLSTLEILKQARDDNLDRVLVLQDDLNFVRAFNQVEEGVVEQLQNEDWDLVQFGYLNGDSNKTYRAKDAFKFERSTQSLIGAHFVGFNGAGLGRFVEFLEELLTRAPGDRNGGPMPIDGALHFFSNKMDDVRRLIIKPVLGYQRSSMSDCTVDSRDRMPLVGTFLKVSRKVKNRLDRMLY